MNTPCIRTLTLCRFLVQDDEELDAGEAFERMQSERVLATNPDSAAFQAARRKTAAGPGTLAAAAAAGHAGAGGASAARFGGVKGAAEATRKLEHEQAIASGTARG